MTHQATDTASAALLKFLETCKRQRDTAYRFANASAARSRARSLANARGDVYDWCATELEAALASRPAPAAPDVVTAESRAELLAQLGTMAPVAEALLDRMHAPAAPDGSVVQAAEDYAMQCVKATGSKFDISELIALKGWFYAGARWAASNPGADVNGPRSSTMESAPAAPKEKK